jgi:hypothetical protein
MASDACHRGLLYKRRLNTHLSLSWKVRHFNILNTSLFTLTHQHIQGHCSSYDISLWKIVFANALTPSGFVSNTVEHIEYKRDSTHKMEYFWNHMTWMYWPSVTLLFATIILSHPHNVTEMHKMETFRNCMICVCWPSLILCEAPVWWHTFPTLIPPKLHSLSL